jgi:hypothetical protein
MGAIRRPKTAKRLAYRLAIKLVRQHAKKVEDAVGVFDARGRLSFEIAQAHARYNAEVPSELRATHFDEAIHHALDCALRGLPITAPKPAPPPKKQKVEPLPDLEPIVDGSYRDAPPSRRRKVPPRGPLVAKDGPHEPLFVEDPNSGPNGMIKLFGILLAVAQLLALLWAAGTHASRGSYLTVVIAIAILLGIPLVIAWQELTTPPDPR